MSYDDLLLEVKSMNVDELLQLKQKMKDLSSILSDHREVKTFVLLPVITEVKESSLEDAFNLVWNKINRQLKIIKEAKFYDTTESKVG